jgi:hypothetical protein
MQPSGSRESNALRDRVIDAMESVRCRLLDDALPQWRFRWSQIGDRIAIHLTFEAPDVHGSRTTLVTHRCREWLIEPAADTAAIVRTLFMAALAALEHEVRETFTYQGHAVCAPHFTIGA